MFINTFSDEYNPPLNAVQLMVSGILMFHENTELLGSGDSYDLSLVNSYPTERIMLDLVGIPVINQLGWV